MVEHVRLELVELIIFLLSELFSVTVGFVYNRWRSTVTDGGVFRYTSHVIFLLHNALVQWCTITPHGSRRAKAKVSAYARHSISMPSMVSGWLFVASLFLALSFSVCLSFTLLFSSHFYLCSDLNSFFHVDNAKAIIPCNSANQGVLLSPRIHSSHRLWAQAPWRLPLLGDYWNDLPGGIGRQRNGALVLVWRWIRRWDHRESAIFTTVHSRARRTSEPETSWSLLWRKHVASSVIFRTLKNGETSEAKWTFAPFVLALSITSSLLLTFVRFHAIFPFFPFLVHCCFCCGDFHGLGHRNKFVNQIVML